MFTLRLSQVTRDISWIHIVTVHAGILQNTGKVFFIILAIYAGKSFMSVRKVPNIKGKMHPSLAAAHQEAAEIQENNETMELIQLLIILSNNEALRGSYRTFIFINYTGQQRKKRSSNNYLFFFY